MDCVLDHLLRTNNSVVYSITDKIPLILTGLLTSFVAVLLSHCTVQVYQSPSTPLVSPRVGKRVPEVNLSKFSMTKLTVLKISERCTTVTRQFQFLPI